MADKLRNLSPRQRALLDQWLPGARVARDHSWGLVETTVLEMTQAWLSGPHRIAPSTVGRLRAEIAG